MGKIKTGIPGFDDLLRGGLQENTALLVSGVPGVGKTILGLQFVYEGIRNREPSMFISCEVDEQSIIDYAQSLGMDLMNYQSLLTIVYQPITGKMLTFGTLVDTITKKKIKRVVLDSLTLFKYIEKSEMEFRQEIANFISSMKRCKVTLVVTAERDVGHLDHMIYRTEDFLFDGLVFITKIRKGASFERCVTIAKIRGQEHMTGIYPLTLDPEGMKIFPEQIPFSLVEQET